jgi:hypothetical protein
VHDFRVLVGVLCRSYVALIDVDDDDDDENNNSNNNDIKNYKETTVNYFRLFPGQPVA